MRANIIKLVFNLIELKNDNIEKFQSFFGVHN